MIDIDTTIQEYADFLRTRKACAPAAPYIESTISPECVYMKDLTAVIDRGETSYAVGWAQWTLRDHGDQMTLALQLCFIKRLDSMRAFQLYVDCAWLSEEADTELKKLFEGKLPEAEKQLANKKQVRAKNA